VRLQDAYPVVVTDRLVACRDFYTRWLGFQVVFEASWFVYLASGAPSTDASAGDRPYGIAFMASDHPSAPLGPETFAGRGLFLTLQVEDARQEFERVWLGLYTWGVGRISDALRRPRLRRALEAVTGAVLVGLGARLAWERR